MKYTLRRMNLDGTCWKQVRVYHMTPLPGGLEYWASVTDVPCPVCSEGTIRWYEAGYVAGYRVCDKCKRHFLAGGNAAEPYLMRVGNRMGF